MRLSLINSDPDPRWHAGACLAGGGRIIALSSDGAPYKMRDAGFEDRPVIACAGRVRRASRLLPVGGSANACPADALRSDARCLGGVFLEHRI